MGANFGDLSLTSDMVLKGFLDFENYGSEKSFFNYLLLYKINILQIRKFLNIYRKLSNFGFYWLELIGRVFFLFFNVCHFFFLGISVKTHIFWWETYTADPLERCALKNAFGRIFEKLKWLKLGRAVTQSLPNIFSQSVFQ